MSYDIHHGLTKLQVVDISHAWAIYRWREFGEQSNMMFFGDIANHDGIIHIAYIEYDIDEWQDYYGYSYCAIQVDYDLYAHVYVYHLISADGTEKIVSKPASIGQFVEDLRICSFEDFIAM